MFVRVVPLYSSRDRKIKCEIECYGPLLELINNESVE